MTTNKILIGVVAILLLGAIYGIYHEYSSLQTASEKRLRTRERERETARSRYADSEMPEYTPSTPTTTIIEPTPPTPSYNIVAPIAPSTKVAQVNDPEKEKYNQVDEVLVNVAATPVLPVSPISFAEFIAYVKIADKKLSVSINALMLATKNLVRAPNIARIDVEEFIRNVKIFQEKIFTTTDAIFLGLVNTARAPKIAKIDVDEFIANAKKLKRYLDDSATAILLAITNVARAPKITPILKIDAEPEIEEITIGALEIMPKFAGKTVVVSPENLPEFEEKINLSVSPNYTFDKLGRDYIALANEFGINFTREIYGALIVSEKFWAYDGRDFFATMLGLRGQYAINENNKIAVYGGYNILTAADNFFSAGANWAGKFASENLNGEYKIAYAYDRVNTLTAVEQNISAHTINAAAQINFLKRVRVDADFYATPRTDENTTIGFSLQPTYQLFTAPFTAYLGYRFAYADSSFNPVETYYAPVDYFSHGAVALLEYNLCEKLALNGLLEIGNAQTKSQTWQIQIRSQLGGEWKINRHLDAYANYQYQELPDYAIHHLRGGVKIKF